MSTARIRVGVDTGGTFTDLVRLDERTGALTIAKLPSTPGDPSEAVAAALAEALAGGGEVAFFSHGTTVGTNALLEGKTAPTALVITAGFRGVYEVREQMRGYGSAIFDFHYRKAAPLARPRETVEARERVGADGTVVTPLTPEIARGVARAVKATGATTVAVCLLFSFRDDRHERLVRDALRAEAPDLAVSLSSEVLPQVREYYRLSTTVANAALVPVLSRYLAKLDERLAAAGVRTPQRYVMQSNGGVTALGGAGARAVTTILSGPAGGVIASEAIGRAAGVPDLVTFDMGGTSCDVALIRDGRAGTSALTKVAGQDIAAPMLDIHTVSAGGGTIARVERHGATRRLRVGPDSAGARPGPVAYGHGGTEPTVTDAHLVTGTLSGKLAGRVTLDGRASREAMRERIAGPLGIGIEEAADGILKIVEVQMAEAIKVISTRRGYDLRDFTLVAFGGAGPLHASRLARDLGMRGVLVPPFPGATSAMGLLLADVRHDHVRSLLAPISRLDPTVPRGAFAALESSARDELGGEGFTGDRVRLMRSVDLRYRGQGYELTVPAPAGEWDEAAVARLRTSFDDEHERRSGHAARDRAVEVVSYRVTGIGLVPPLELPRAARLAGDAARAHTGERAVWADGAPRAHAVYARERLGAGDRVSGPAIIEQLDATVLVLADQVATVDDHGNLRIAS